MPQLWTETIVTQYFWLVVILFGFYYIAVTQLIPQIAYTLKTRKALENAVKDSAEGNDNLLLNDTKSLLSTILTPRIPTIKSNSTDQLKASLSAVKSDWISKHIS